jgi:hypothetical protein
MSECPKSLCAELGGTSGTEPKKPTFAHAGRTWGTLSNSYSLTGAKLRPPAQWSNPQRLDAARLNHKKVSTSPFRITRTRGTRLPNAPSKIGATVTGRDSR